MSELPISEKKSGGCQCGCSHDEAVLDARELPPIIRHGAILGSISQLQPGASFNLIAPHNPLPLLDQVKEAYGDSVEVSYVSEEPWTIKFLKK
ncbi:DUF2249 domain-containing protein [Arcanobacterium ihumii]|uniref:DUF2249 domain-containing protein n=1 Tax=Arcanobacterium ihumii TaxID=2138162 RepID=UPI000F54B87A|nr:DUF2249 domain-containing protein [Arcanobacterium ihumii]